jgi:hypothetical protein
VTRSAAAGSKIPWWPTAVACPSWSEPAGQLGTGQVAAGLDIRWVEQPATGRARSADGRHRRQRANRSETLSYRHELLRLLLPTIVLPQGFFTAAEVEISEASEQVQVSVSGQVFLEHLGGAPAMLPAQRMQARLEFDTQQFPWRVPPVRIQLEPRPLTALRPSPMTGVDPREDGVMIIGSGAMRVSGRKRFDLRPLDLIGKVPTVQVRCSVAVAGTDRRLELVAKLDRVRRRDGLGKYCGRSPNRRKTHGHLTKLDSNKAKNGQKEDVWSGELRSAPQDGPARLSRSCSSTVGRAT